MQSHVIVPFLSPGLAGVMYFSERAYSSAFNLLICHRASIKMDHGCSDGIYLASVSIIELLYYVMQIFIKLVLVLVYYYCGKDLYHVANSSLRSIFGSYSIIRCVHQRAKAFSNSRSFDLFRILMELVSAFEGIMLI